MVRPVGFEREAAMIFICKYTHNTQFERSIFPNQEKYTMDTLSNLKAFIAVADAGSFSEVARRQQVAPSVMREVMQVGD